MACELCGGKYPIRDGICMLLRNGVLDGESAHEMEIRDGWSRESIVQDAGQEATDWDRMEMGPTIAALGLRGGQVVLEFGCGTGRYTLPVSRMGISLIGLDFSMESLRLLARRLPPGLMVGLAQADATRPCVSPRSFDRILSTLVSNLPTKEHRLAMMRAGSSALKESGRFVFSTHYQNLPNRLLGRPQAGRYDEGGIFRYYMLEEEIIRESLVYFRRSRCRPIRVDMPFTRWVGVSPVTVSRILERVPLLRQLSDLLLATASGPIRTPGEDEGTRPSRAFRAVRTFVNKLASP